MCQFGYRLKVTYFVIMPTHANTLRAESRNVDVGFLLTDFARFVLRHPLAEGQAPDAGLAQLRPADHHEDAQGGSARHMEVHPAPPRADH